MISAEESNRRMRTFVERLKSIICPACMRRPHPHTVMPLRVDDLCDWDDCGKAHYISLRSDHKIADESL